MRGFVITVPQPPQTLLTPHVPDLEIHVRQINGGHVLAHRGHGVARGRRGWGLTLGSAAVGVCGRGVEQRPDLVEQGGFARVVQTEEEDGVLFFAGGVEIE